MLSSFSMRRLNLRFKEFTGHHWANDEVKALWEPRLRKVCACIAELEWRSILGGLRDCALKIVRPDELQALGSMLAPHGLIVAPLEKIAAGNRFAFSRTAPQPGEPFHYWCVIGRPPDVRLVQLERSNKDPAVFGRFLGYPSCCTDFYRSVRTLAGFMDTTWPMGHNTAAKKSLSPTHIEIPETSWCNLLLSRLGIRIVFHLPCSFDCPSTVELAGKLIQLAEAAGFQQEIEWLEEMLRWPMEWSALHGIGEVTTPVGTIFSATDVTAERYRVSYRGTNYGSEVGTCCSNGNPRERHSAPRGEEEKPSVERRVPFAAEPFRDLEWYYADNGFRSMEAMAMEQEPVVKLASETLRHTSGRVLDLGCGNGVLLKKICDSNHGLIPWGVDRSGDKIAHARMLTPQCADNFILSDIFDDSVWSRNHEFRLVILMLGRLLEVDDKQSENLLRRIRAHAGHFLVYAYDAVLHQHGSLDELARKTGLILSEYRAGANVALAHQEDR